MRCVFWDPTLNDWLQDGCSTELSTGLSGSGCYTVTCKCNHMTHFTIVFVSIARLIRTITTETISSHSTNECLYRYTSMFVIYHSKFPTEVLPRLFSHVTGATILQYCVVCKRIAAEPVSPYINICILIYSNLSEMLRSPNMRISFILP